MLLLALGCHPHAPVGCPPGTSQTERDVPGGLVEARCLPDGAESPDGPVEYRRGDRVVVRGAFSMGTRTGPWTLFGPDGAVRATGDYGRFGVPAGTWRFADGDRTWGAPDDPDGGRFEPEPPLALLWAKDRRGLFRGAEPHVDVLDYDLERGVIAADVTARLERGGLAAEVTLCTYPHRATGTGVRRALILADRLDPDPVWTVLAAAGDCTADPQAAERAADAALAGEGLDPGRHPPVVPPIPVDVPPSAGVRVLLRGAELPFTPLSWRFAAAGHRVDLARIARPGVEVELGIAALAAGDWRPDLDHGDRTFLELSVDGVPVWWVLAAGDGARGAITVAPFGLLVDGDRASLLLGATTRDRTRVVASPVFSLSTPTPVGPRLR